MADDKETVDGGDNIISLEQFKAARSTHDNDGALDDDELIRRAGDKIAEWQAAGAPSLSEVQDLFSDLIRSRASPMARDKIIAIIVAAFGVELGSKRAMISTWTQLCKEYAAVCAQDAREGTSRPELTPEEKAALQ